MEKDLGLLKGKTTRSKPEHVPVDNTVTVEKQNIILSMDIMYFTGLTFLVTVSRKVRFITVTLLVDRDREYNYESN
jgi:hypothetical protein